MSFRKGLETLRLAAHNTRAYWAVLKSVFAVGSTRAHQLARRFGLDPDRMREGRVVNIGEGCYCNACDSYHCAQCGEVTTYSTDCGNCTKRCSICGDPREDACNVHQPENDS